MSKILWAGLVNWWGKAKSEAPAETPWLERHKYPNEGLYIPPRICQTQTLSVLYLEVVVLFDGTHIDLLRTNALFSPGETHSVYPSTGRERESQSFDTSTALRAVTTLAPRPPQPSSWPCLCLLARHDLTRSHHRVARAGDAVGGLCTEAEGNGPEESSPFCILL